MSTDKLINGLIEVLQEGKPKGFSDEEIKMLEEKREVYFDASLEYFSVAEAYDGEPYYTTGEEDLATARRLYKIANGIDLILKNYKGA